VLGPGIDTLLTVAPNGLTDSGTLRCRNGLALEVLVGRMETSDPFKRRFLVPALTLGE
jgi:hypothetical protein